MPAKKKPSTPPLTLKQGRRSAQDKLSNRWKITIKETTETKGPHSWTTFLCQGWKEDGRWMKRRFKSLAEAESFRAGKQLEHLPDADPVRMVPTGLSLERVREAELAFAQLDALGPLTGPDAQPIAPTVGDAVRHYIAHLKASHAVERVPILRALDECLADKLSRGVMRHRSALQLKSSVRLFTSWLRNLPRFTAGSIDHDWSPSVSEVTTDDVVRYLASIRSKNGQPAAPKTLNNARADLRGFFGWATGQERDARIPGCARRWHSLNPVADVAKLVVPQGSPDVLSVKDATHLMRALERDRPQYVPFFALALFSGLRPGENGELHKLARHPNLSTPCREAGGRPLIDLERGIITILPEIAKTKRKRVVPISANLAGWLNRFGTTILPVGFQTGLEQIRKSASLTPDIARHSFISFRTALTGSKARAALEAGTSEGVIDRHYLNVPTESEAKEFWDISPTL